ncbi:hypothetical protein D3C84_643050 [compost metagenome]
MAQAPLEVTAGGLALFPFGHARVRQHHRVGALVIEQWRASEIIKRHHLADHDPVIAAIDLLEFFTVKTRRAIDKHRGAAFAGLEFDFSEAVLLGSCEVVRQVDLVGGQHVHRKVAGGFEHAMAARTLVDAPQDQWRVQGHRVETVGRHTDLAAIFSGSGDHGHAGGEVTQGPAERAGIESGITKTGHARLPAASSDGLDYCSRVQRTGGQTMDGSGSSPISSRPRICAQTS